MICQATQALYQNAVDYCHQGQQALYARALKKGRRGQLWTSLTGHPRQLLSLAEASGACAVQARSSGGVRTVAIAHIFGSENRVADFDCEFNPLQDHTRERWLGIAAAMQRGRALPPVALIQMGDRYFVRDGHHRISVARALGQTAIEATVEVWQVDERRPKEWLLKAQGGSRARSHTAPRAVTNSSPSTSILQWLSGLPRWPGRAEADQAAS